MPVCAYILIEVEGKNIKQVVTQLRRIRGVKCADAVTGPYDVIACVEAPDPAKMGNLVLSKIRAVQGVRRTITCVAVQT
jgi:DNA-binding Lrp family transcriptional regulator